MVVYLHYTRIIIMLLFLFVESYSFPSIGGPLHIGGGGSSMKHDAINLPPPSWRSQQNSGLKGQDVTSSQQDNEDSTTQLNVPVLGADIIAEQFGDKPKPGHVPPGSQATPTHPTNSPQFGFPPPQRLFDEQGRPPPSENMNFQRLDHDRGGIPPHGGPPPPDHFRRPPQDQQREWQGRGPPPPPPGREFVRPEFRGPPGPGPGPGGEFGRPSPYSWQRSIATSHRERRPSYEEHRFPPQENPYVYRRPEGADMQRDPRDPRWREGPHPPPRRGQPWEESGGPPPPHPPAPPHARGGPPIREEFPDGRGPPQGAPRR